MVSSSNQARTPFWGLVVPSEALSESSGRPLVVGSSPISKGADANEYWSENIRGIKGILPKKPHFPLPFSTAAAVALGRLHGNAPLTGLEGLWSSRSFSGSGTSKMWRVPLSELQASRLLSLLKASEKMAALSQPRRSSQIRAQLRVFQIRMRVPWKRNECSVVSETVGLETRTYVLASSGEQVTLRAQRHGAKRGGVSWDDAHVASIILNNLDMTRRASREGSKLGGHTDHAQ